MFGSGGLAWFLLISGHQFYCRRCRRHSQRDFANGKPARCNQDGQGNDVKFVDFRFTDTRGKEQHVTVPVSPSTRTSSGHAFDGSSIAGWRGIQASDMLLMPDPRPPTSTPFFDETTLVLTCDVVDPADGRGYDRDPRSIAKRAEAYLKSSGIGDTAYFGPEPEFFISTASIGASICRAAA